MNILLVNTNRMKPAIAPIGLDYVADSLIEAGTSCGCSQEEVDSNYNYNDNTVLIRAIENGARGAYWDILRRMR